jgi:hypothetical protein
MKPMNKQKLASLCFLLPSAYLEETSRRVLKGAVNSAEALLKRIYH